MEQAPLDLELTNKVRSNRAADALAGITETGKAFPTVKAVAILEAMATVRRPLGVTEVGMLLVRLGLGVVAASMLSAPRHAILEALSQKIGETCNFGVMADNHVVYLDRVESAWPFGLRFEPGSHVPLHCTSMGKLFLSLMPAKKCALLLRSIPLYRYTENTITDAARLEAELKNIRSAEVSTDNQEFLAGVVCVAVPVRDTNKQPVAALAVSAPLARMTLQQGLQHVPLLQAAAEQLTVTIDEADIV